MVQTVVNSQQPFGMEGCFYDDAPRIADPYTLTSNGANPARIGYAFTTTNATPQTAKVGGSDVFAGILVSPHELVRDSLTNSLVVPDGTIGTLATMGRIVVKPAQAAQIGYLGCYNTTTGQIGAYTGNTVPTGYAAIPNSKYVLVGSAVGEVAVLELN